ILMFITSFGEQNITYKCCSNFLIHLFHLALKVSRTEFICGPIRCTVDFSCWLLHSEIILLNQTLQTALCNKAVFKYFF
ncbi:hypothetical protein CAS78_08615, partial [Acinetobacter pittii]